MKTLSITKPDIQGAAAYFQNKMKYSTGPVEVSHLLEDEQNADFQLVDVRARQDYDKAHIPGAINLPEDEWGNASRVLSRDKTNILYCYSQSCHLAAKAGAFFAAQGFPVMEMDGGFNTWENNDFDVETSGREEA